MNINNQYFQTDDEKNRKWKNNAREHTHRAETEWAKKTQNYVSNIWSTTNFKLTPSTQSEIERNHYSLVGRKIIYVITNMYLYMKCINYARDVSHTHTRPMCSHPNEEKRKANEKTKPFRTTIFPFFVLPLRCFMQPTHTVNHLLNI